MKTKLKNLSVTSVDLVDRGANPDAHVRLFKRKEAEPERDPDASLFQKFMAWLAKGFQDATTLGGEEATAGENPEGTVEKEAQTFSDNITREQLREVTNEMFDNCYALSDSFCSIVCDKDMDAAAKEAMLLKSLDEFAQAVRGAASQWAKGQKASEPGEQDGIQKSAAQQGALAKLLGQYGLGGELAQTTHEPKGEKEETDTMKIDKSKMTPEEQATLAEFEKKYGIAEPAEGGGTPPADPAPAGGVEKHAESPAAPEQPAVPAGGALHPDVAKALSDFEAMKKQQTAEIEALKKSLEVERLTALAKKYEVLGKKAPELAEKLYALKKAGGTVYDDYVALLDESVAAVTKGGLFGEIGSSRQGSAGTEQTIGIKAAELAKSAQGGMTSTDAIIKAFEENPELAAQYEAEYFGR